MSSVMRHTRRFFTAEYLRCLVVVTVVTIAVFPAATPSPAALPYGQTGGPVAAAKATPPSVLERGQETFPSAKEACQALVTALKTNDQSALLTILGPGAKNIISSGDGVEDKNNREDFVQKYQQMHRLVSEPNGTTTLYIGAENWPTPIPLTNEGKEWFFDTPAGKQEILYRRVGRNELAVIQVCHELVDAQKEYYSQPHDGESVRQYAQKIFSDPHKHNGLYWEVSPGEKESPIGPLLAVASEEGYTQDSGHRRQPFQGYYFRILTGQGANAPGGAKSYLSQGKMTGGFAFLAYPAEYRSSGIMTFIVDQDGVVYQKDLGARTAELAKSLARYDRDATWAKAD
jgi:hypothetical protein